MGLVDQVMERKKRAASKNKKHIRPEEGLKPTLGKCFVSKNTKRKNCHWAELEPRAWNGVIGIDGIGDT